jgi:hypothetical protein
MVPQGKLKGKELLYKKQMGEQQERDQEQEKNKNKEEIKKDLHLLQRTRVLICIQSQCPIPLLCCFYNDSLPPHSRRFSFSHGD